MPISSKLDFFFAAMQNFEIKLFPVQNTRVRVVHAPYLTALSAVPMVPKSLDENLGLPQKVMGGKWYYLRVGLPPDHSKKCPYPSRGRLVEGRNP